MSTDTRDERLERRIEDLSANDPQFAAARPSPAVTAALEQPGLRLPQIVQTVLDGYADRPALGQRAVEFVKDRRPDAPRPSCCPASTPSPTASWATASARSPRALADDAGAGRRPRLRARLHQRRLRHRRHGAGADSARCRVPLQTSAPVTQLQPIVVETEPSVIAASVDHLPDAVELGADRPRARAAGGVRLPPRGRRPPRGLGGRRGAAGRHAPVTVETLADVLDRGKRAAGRGPVLDRRRRRPAGAADLHLRQHRRPKGAMYTRATVAKLWRRSQQELGSADSARRRSP